MSIGHVLYKAVEEEENALPLWVRCLPKKWQSNYIETKSPYEIAISEDGIVTGTLSIACGNGLPENYRTAAEEMLYEMKQCGVSIILPPKQGEIPRNILPIAWGRYLTALYGFLGAEYCLRQRGKTPEECHFVIVGGEPYFVELLLLHMTNSINQLSLFHKKPEEFDEIQEILFQERGLPTEIFSSPRNPNLSHADVVFLCDFAQVGYEHILKENSIFIDIVGNASVTRNLYQRRNDVRVMNGFQFMVDDIFYTTKELEALLYDTTQEMRQIYSGQMSNGNMLEKLQKDGVKLKGHELDLN